MALELLARRECAAEASAACRRQCQAESLCARGTEREVLAQAERRVELRLGVGVGVGVGAGLGVGVDGGVGMRMQLLLRVAQGGHNKGAAGSSRDGNSLGSARET